MASLSPVRRRASSKGIHLVSQAATTEEKLSGVGSSGRPNTTPRAAEHHAPGLGRRDALLLPLADVLPFVLGHKGENLQHQVRDEGAHQVPALPGVQQGHVDDADVRADLLGEHPPLILNLLVIASQPVDAQDVQQVARPQPLDQPLVLGTPEILPRLLIQKNMSLGRAALPQGDSLPGLVLVGAGDPDVPRSSDRSSAPTSRRPWASGRPRGSG